jgi:hypothetical protein
MPGLGPRITQESRWLLLAPPMWFVGVERWLLGERVPFLVKMAQVAMLASAAAGAVALGSYAILYARFDRIMLRSFRRSSAWPGRLRELRRRLDRRPGQCLAIHDFTTTALRRSSLHQGILVGLSACGVAVVVNSLVNNGLFQVYRVPAEPSRRLLGALTWAPCAMMFIATIAVRTALVVPLEPRANWLFRMTEVDEARADQLDAVAQVMRWVGVGIPVVIALPAQWVVLGSTSLVTSAIAAAYGFLLVECHMRDWRRIPFTCSYLPGKHAVTNSVLMGFVAFWVFASFGAGLQRAGYANPWKGLGAVAVLAVSTALLQRKRRQAWAVLPLMFEDLMPTEVQPIGLSRE